MSSSFFDDFLGKTKGVADAAGKKTGELVEISKLKLQCVQLNSDIRERYEKLGSAVYSMVKSDYENPELVNSMVEEITELLDKLNETSEKIADIKNISICTCCGAKNPPENCYCSKCGSRLTGKEQGFDKEYQDMASEAGKSAEEETPSENSGE